MTQPQKVNTNPYTIEKGEHYIPSLSSLTRVYTQHPDFKPAVKLVYDLLFDYYNPEYGYAFPTIRQLERDSGLSASSIKRHIKTLENLDLLEKGRSKFGNNIYVVKKPVRTLDELYEKFPEIKEESEKRLQRIEEEEALEKERRDEKITKKPAENKPVMAFSTIEITEVDEIDESFF